MIKSSNDEKRSTQISNIDDIRQSISRFYELKVVLIFHLLTSFHRLDLINYAPNRIIYKRSHSVIIIIYTASNNASLIFVTMACLSAILSHLPCPICFLECISVLVFTIVTSKLPVFPRSDCSVTAINSLNSCVR